MWERDIDWLPLTTGDESTTQACALLTRSQTGDLFRSAVQCPTHWDKTEPPVRALISSWHDFLSLCTFSSPNFIFFYVKSLVILLRAHSNDVILTYHLQRPYFQIMLHSQVLGVRTLTSFGGHTIQTVTPIILELNLPTVYLCWQPSAAQEKYPHLLCHFHLSYRVHLRSHLFKEATINIDLKNEWTTLQSKINMWLVIM